MEATEEMEQCSIGLKLGQKCHQNFPVKRTPGKMAISELKPDEKELLQWRTEVDIPIDGDICFHHYAACVTHYGNLQTTCAFSKTRHQKPVKSKFDLDCIIDIDMIL